MKPTNREHVFVKGYRDFEYKAVGSKLGLPEPVETIVWSSKNG